MIKIFFRNKILNVGCRIFRPCSQIFDTFEYSKSLHGYIPNYQVSFLKRPVQKPGATEDFTEKMFIKKFVDTFNSSERNSPQVIKKLLEELDKNINLLNEPVSFLAILFRCHL